MSQEAAARARIKRLENEHSDRAVNFRMAQRDRERAIRRDQLLPEGRDEPVRLELLQRVNDTAGCRSTILRPRTSNG